LGKPVKVSKGDLQYLANALKEKKPYTEMARHLNICVDTVKRILQREGLAEFEGAKYVVALSNTKNTKYWNRPCMKCKTTKTRPKWQYFCDKCTEINEQYSGLPKEWLWDD
jgi:IS30 family transposase